MPESRHPEEMRHAAHTTLWSAEGVPNDNVSEDAHALTCALMYIGDVLQGIGWLYDQKIRAEAFGFNAARNDTDQHPSQHPSQPVRDTPSDTAHALHRLAEVARQADMPGMIAYPTSRGLGVTTEEDLRPETITDLLALIGIRATRDEVSAWDVDMRRHAADYAAAVHLRASGNPDVIIPPRPPFLT